MQSLLHVTDFKFLYKHSYITGVFHEISFTLHIIKRPRYCVMKHSKELWQRMTY